MLSLLALASILRGQSTRPPTWNQVGGNSQGFLSALASDEKYEVEVAYQGKAIKGLVRQFAVKMSSQPALRSSAVRAMKAMFKNLYMDFNVYVIDADGTTAVTMSYTHEEGDLAFRTSWDIYIAEEMLEEGLLKIDDAEIARAAPAFRANYRQKQAKAIAGGLGMWRNSKGP